MNDLVADANSLRRTLHWPGVCAGLALVFIVHSCLVLLLYRGRVVSHWPFSDSDAIVFGIPSLIAYSAIVYLCIRSPALRQLRTVGRVSSILALSLVVVFFSVWFSMLLPLNLYGS